MRSCSYSSASVSFGKRYAYRSLTIFLHDFAIFSARYFNHYLILIFTGDLGEADVNVESLCWGTGETEEAGDFRDSIVGKIIGVDEKFNLAKNAVDDEEAPEPLALLAIHAAMHMLFLPQFTCDFYEEEANDDDSASSDDEEEGYLEKNLKKAEKEEEERQEKVDKAMKSEAGLKKVRYAFEGILLQPKPACIVWSGGCGVKSKKVR